MTSSLFVAVSNDRNKYNLHNRVQEFIVIYSTNTSLYIIFTLINYLVNVMGITLGMVVMAFDKFLISLSFHR